MHYFDISCLSILNYYFFLVLLVLWMSRKISNFFNFQIVLLNEYFKNLSARDPSWKGISLSSKKYLKYFVANLAIQSFHYCIIF